jgi:hypothetical protein
MLFRNCFLVTALVLVATVFSTSFAFAQQSVPIIRFDSVTNPLKLRGPELVIHYLVELLV